MKYTTFEKLEQDLASRDVEVATLETRLEEKTEECQSFYEEAERVVKERDQLREHLEASRANDRTAMMYLSEIKAAAAHEGDFPSLVLKVAQLREQVKLLRDVILKQMESENRWPDYIIEALATAKHLGVE